MATDSQTNQDKNPNKKQILSNEVKKSPLPIPNNPETQFHQIAISPQAIKTTP